MQNFFIEGGVGMYPTLFFGVASLALAAIYAAKPGPRWVPLIVGFGGASLLAGMLGTVIGLKATIAAITHDASIPAEQLKLIALAGASESSNNLVLALVLTTLVALALGAGGFRARVPARTAPAVG